MTKVSIGEDLQVQWTPRLGALVESRLPVVFEQNLGLPYFELCGHQDNLIVIETKRNKCEGITYPGSRIATCFFSDGSESHPLNINENVHWDGKNEAIDVLCEQQRGNEAKRPEGFINSNQHMWDSVGSNSRRDLHRNKAWVRIVKSMNTLHICHGQPRACHGSFVQREASMAPLQHLVEHM